LQHLNSRTFKDQWVPCALTAICLQTFLTGTRWLYDVGCIYR